jgi:hypothetical protein
MAAHLSVFCRSDMVITRRELAEFIADGAFFDEAPVFSHAAGAEAADPLWSSLEIRTAPGKRPVTIERFTGTATGPFVDEALDRLREAGLFERHPKLVTHLRETCQVFILEAAALAETDDCWEMLDCVEAHLARELDGVIAADDGFYDRDLRPSCELR